MPRPAKFSLDDDSTYESAQETTRADEETSPAPAPTSSKAEATSAAKPKASDAASKSDVVEPPKRRKDSMPLPKRREKSAAKPTQKYVRFADTSHAADFSHLLGAELGMSFQEFCEASFNYYLEASGYDFRVRGK